MEEVVFTALVIALGMAFHAGIRRAHMPREWRLLDAGFIAHIVGGFAHVLAYRYYYGGGDEIAYHDWGADVAEGLRRDFWNVLPETVSVALHAEHHLPFNLIGEGSTGTMQMIAAWLDFLLGDSMFAATLLIAILAYASKVAVYHALRPDFDEAEHPRVFMAAMFVPSAIFWTAALLKEPIVMVCFGPALLAVRWIIESRRLLAASVLLAGSTMVMALLKPYIVLAGGVAVGVWIGWARALRLRGTFSVKPQYLVIGALAVIGSFQVAQSFFPSLSERGLGQSIAEQRRTSINEQGGSNYSLESGAFDVDSTEGTSLTAQIALVPLALVTALYRPFIVEARNPMQAANALETLWFLVLTFQVFRRNGLQRIALRVTGSPVLMMSATFTLLIGLGTSLASANLGALSRYRSPMIPFFVLLLLHLRDTAGAARKPSQPKPGGAATLPGQRGAGARVGISATPAARAPG
jgi:hypothetical protein